MKCNSDNVVLKTLADLGAGFDCASKVICFCCSTFSPATGSSLFHDILSFEETLEINIRGNNRSSKHKNLSGSHLMVLIRGKVIGEKS